MNSIALNKKRRQNSEEKITAEALRTQRKQKKYNR